MKWWIFLPWKVLFLAHFDHISTMRFATYVTRTIHKGYQSLDSPFNSQEPDYNQASVKVPEETSVSQPRNTIEDNKIDARPARREPTQFGKFPTFRGFDDIMDFDDMEESDDDWEIIL